MDDNDLWEIRAAVEILKEKAGKAISNLIDETKGWSVEKLTAARIPEEMAALTNHQESLFLITDKLDEIEGCPKREIPE